MVTNLGPQTNDWACKHICGERVEMKRSERQSSPEKERERKRSHPKHSPDMAENTFQLSSFNYL